jgi:hypothetical protein
MAHRSNVFPKMDPLPKSRVSALLSAGWARVASKVGKGKLADGVDATEKTVENAMAQRTVPDLHTALNSLTVDASALDELFAGYGLKIAPLHAEAANDLVTAAGVIDAMGELVKAMGDGHRDHNETLAIATLLRPYMPALQAIIAQADVLRGAA